MSNIIDIDIDHHTLSITHDTITNHVTKLSIINKETYDKYNQDNSLYILNKITNIDPDQFLEFIMDGYNKKHNTFLKIKEVPKNKCELSIENNSKYFKFTIIIELFSDSQFHQVYTDFNPNQSTQNSTQQTTQQSNELIKKNNENIISTQRVEIEKLTDILNKKKKELSNIISKLQDNQFHKGYVPKSYLKISDRFPHLTYAEVVEFEKKVRDNNGSIYVHKGHFKERIFTRVKQFNSDPFYITRPVSILVAQHYKKTVYNDNYHTNFLEKKQVSCWSCCPNLNLTEFYIDKKSCGIPSNIYMWNMEFQGTSLEPSMFEPISGIINLSDEYKEKIMNNVCMYDNIYKPSVSRSLDTPTHVIYNIIGNNEFPFKEIEIKHYNINILRNQDQSQSQNIGDKNIVDIIYDLYSNKLNQHQNYNNNNILTNNNLESIYPNINIHINNSVDNLGENLYSQEDLDKLYILADSECITMKLSQNIDFYTGLNIDLSLDNRNTEEIFLTLTNKYKERLKKSSLSMFERDPSGECFCDKELFTLEYDNELWVSKHEKSLLENIKTLNIDKQELHKTIDNLENKIKELKIIINNYNDEKNVIKNIVNK